MNDLISRSELLNKIGKECHYDSEHPLESYSKLLWTVCSMPIAKSEQITFFGDGQKLFSIGVQDEEES